MLQRLIDAYGKAFVRSTNRFGCNGSHAAQKEAIAEPLIGGMNQVGAHISLSSGRKKAGEAGQGLKSNKAGVTPISDSMPFPGKSQMA
jgi:hypothetical protein